MVLSDLETYVPLKKGRPRLTEAQLAKRIENLKKQVDPEILGDVSSLSYEALKYRVWYLTNTINDTANIPVNVGVSSQPLIRPDTRGQSHTSNFRNKENTDIVVS